MDEDRILAALRAGPPDEPPYIPRRIRPVPIAAVAVRRAGTRRSPDLALLAAAIAGLVLVAGVIGAGSALLRGRVTPSPHGDLVSPSSPAPGSLAHVLSTGTLRVGLATTYAELEGSTNRSAFDREVAQAVADRLGVVLIPVRVDRDRIDAGGGAGRFDVAIDSTLVAPDRSPELVLSAPYYYTPAYVLIYAPGLTNVAELAGHSICVGSASLGARWARGTLAITSLTDVTMPPANLIINEMLTQRECTSPHLRYSDAAVSDLAEPGSSSAVTRVAPPVFTEQFAFGFDRATADPALIDRLNAVIATLRADGTIARLSQFWLGADMSQPTP